MKNILSLLFLIIFGINLNAQVSGTVFRDYNFDGVYDATSEPLLSGVLVNVYNSAGVLCGTNTTSGNSSPNYTISTVCTGSLRVEFYINGHGCTDSIYDYPSPTGSVYGSNVQFVTAPKTNVNYAVRSSGDFYGNASTTWAVTPVQINGNPLDTSGNLDQIKSFFAYKYSLPNIGENYDLTDKNTTAEKLGCLYGVAYSKQARKIFSSAFVKRHAGLGPLGTGGIYMLDTTATSLTVANFYDMDANGYRTRAPQTGSPVYGQNSSYSIDSLTTIPLPQGTVNGGGYYQKVKFLGTLDPISGEPVGLGVVGTNIDRGLPIIQAIPSFDGAAFGQIGKVGIGDLDISDDGKYLFLTNLYDRKIYRLELDNPYNPTSIVSVQSFTLPSVTVVNGKLRPFGLKYYKGNLYAGAVSTAENGGTRNNMNAYVFLLKNPQQNSSIFEATPIITQSLSYNKGTSWGGPYGNDYYWNPWCDSTNNNIYYKYFDAGFVNTTYPTPMLTDIEFSDRGDMILGFRDRSGDQYGWGQRYSLDSISGLHYNLGLGKTYYTVTYVSGGDIIMAGKICDSTSYSMENLAQVKTINGITLYGGGNSGIGGIEFFGGDGGLHAEMHQGSMALITGLSEVLTTTYDPYYYTTGGVRKLSTTNGSSVGNYQLYGPDGGSVSGLLTYYNGKANALGDVEVLSSIEPIEIGNRIWIDGNGNGIQDANETTPGVPSGTIVTLRSPGVDGIYGNGDDQTWTTTTNATGNYYFKNLAGGDNRNLVISQSVNNTILPGYDYRVEVAKPFGLYLTTTDVGGGTNDVRDNDATINGSIAVVQVNTSKTDHNFDIGFSNIATCSSTIATTPGTCNSSTNQYTLTGTVTFTNPPSTGTLTVQIAGGGSQVFNAPFTSPQSYSIVGQIADGVSHTVTAMFSTDGSCTSSVTYTAPVNCTPNTCSISLTATPGTCSPANNQYNITGSITFANAPTTGTLTVSVGAITQTFNAPFTSPQAYTLSGLTSDGSSHTATAVFSADGSCTSSVTYTAPTACGCNNTPYPLCPGESYTLTAQSGYQNYQWYTVSGTTETPISGAMSQTYVVTATGIYKWRAEDNGGCPVDACCKYEFIPQNCVVCSIANVGLIIGNCDNKGTLLNASDDEYTFTLNPTGTDLGTTYTVTGLPNSPQTGTYGSPTTFGPYLISSGVLNITVTDNTTSGCTATATVNPPPSCSSCNVNPPVLSVNDNICPSRTGTINVVQVCGSGTFIQYSTNNGASWTTVKPFYSTSPLTILSRCVYNGDTTCKSAIASVTTNPKKCPPSSGNECMLIANANIDPCNNNNTDDILIDDYFTIQINATASNGGTSNKYEVVFGADPLTGIGGNVLNSGGTTYGSPITIGQNKIFEANGITAFQLIVRDINNNNCFQSIDIQPVVPCSIAPPKSPCHPVPCVPLEIIKN